MTNVELSHVIAEKLGHSEAERLDLLAVYNKQRPEAEKPVMPPRALKARATSDRSIDIGKTWPTDSQMDKGLSPKGLGINSGGGFIR